MQIVPPLAPSPVRVDHTFKAIGDIIMTVGERVHQEQNLTARTFNGQRGFDFDHFGFSKHKP